MKGLGIFLLIIGVIATIASFSMDVTVSTGYGTRVNNIGLMSDRQNYILVSCLVILCGILLMIFGKKTLEVTKCPFCAESVNAKAIKCKHCGSDLSPAKPSSVNYRFSLSNYNPSELIGIKDGNKIISEYAVKKLVFDVKKNNPKMNGALLKLKYNNEIDELSNKLPKNLRDDFISKFYILIES